MPCAAVAACHRLSKDGELRCCPLTTGQEGQTEIRGERSRVCVRMRVEQTSRAGVSMRVSVVRFEHVSCDPCGVLCVCVCAHERIFTRVFVFVCVVLFPSCTLNCLRLDIFSCVRVRV
eukprot:GDKI01009163.1.p3 GENE.GDKI01009163.1~~GDKI01009163.1.p3  ORF type:complete len:118 (-),score=26.07 GDKI01009163.1:102-455(-)